jgi:hypothetical protein
LIRPIAFSATRLPCFGDAAPSQRTPALSPSGLKDGADELSLACGITRAVERIFGGEDSLERLVLGSDLGMSAKIVAEHQKAIPGEATKPDYMEMYRSQVERALVEIAQPGNPELGYELVIYVLEGPDEPTDIGKRAKSQKDIKDGLGAQFRDSRASDVFDFHSLLTQSSHKNPFLLLEYLGPYRMMRHEDDG